MTADTASKIAHNFFAGVLAGLLLLAAGCGPLRDLEPAPVDLSEQWKPLLDELRAFERTLGFRETRNFARLTDEHESYAYCGWSSRHVLPYSYEDPAIRWLESPDYEQCRAAAPDHDWHFGTVEAWGEIGTPVTPAMLAGGVDRFVYLVIHEDCHDQFSLPYGIEEALCNLITYRAMTQFATQKYRWYTRENRAIRSYGRVEARQTRTTVAHYREVEALYERYRRQELTFDELLRARDAVYRRLERALGLPEGEINNVSLASLMTYSRHYGALEAVLDRFGPDLARAVEFFRAVDAAKPTPESLMRALGTDDEKSLAVVRAKEEAVLDTIRRQLRTRTAAAAVP